MSFETQDRSPHIPRRRRAGRSLRRLAAVVVGLAIVLAAYGGYAYLSHQPPAGTTPLVVYTYGSFFGGGCGGNASGILAPFEAAHHVAISFVCPSGSLLTTLSNERNAPGADLVIGLDEVTSTRAAQEGLLVPYVSPHLGDVDPRLVAELDPLHHVTPYEWGYLAIDYTTDFWNATAGAVGHAAFSDFTNNSTWAQGLLIEDPTQDITGAEFLLWEIEFYEHVLHQDWTTWWQQVAPHVRFAPDWGTAFGEFSTPPNNPPMVVSYTTDAAYAAWAGAPGSLNGTVSHWGGTAYGWRTVYGMGVVNGSAHVGLSEQLIDWFLNGSVQAEIPTNEWEYPANVTTPWPPEFAAAVAPSGIVPLDDLTTPSDIAANLPGYLDTWQTVMSQYG